MAAARSPAIQREGGRGLSRSIAMMALGGIFEVVSLRLAV